MSDSTEVSSAALAAQVAGTRTNGPYRKIGIALIAVVLAAVLGYGWHTYFATNVVFPDEGVSAVQKAVANSKFIQVVTNVTPTPQEVAIAQAQRASSPQNLGLTSVGSIGNQADEAWCVLATFSTPSGGADIQVIAYRIGAVWQADASVSGTDFADLGCSLQRTPSSSTV